VCPAWQVLPLIGNLADESACILLGGGKRRERCGADRKWRTATFKGDGGITRLASGRPWESNEGITWEEEAHPARTHGGLAY